MKQTTTNTFSEGLIKDLNPLTTPNNVLTDCLNGTLITFNGNEFALQNDMGNGKVENAKLPVGYIPLGMKEYGGIVYIVAYNPLTNKSQIGSFPAPDYEVSENHTYNNTVNNISNVDLFDNLKLSAGDKFNITTTLPTEGLQELNENLIMRLAVLNSNNVLEFLTDQPLSPEEFKTLYAQQQVYQNKTSGKLYVILEIKGLTEFEVYTNTDYDSTTEVYKISFTCSGNPTAVFKFVKLNIGSEEDNFQSLNGNQTVIELEASKLEADAPLYYTLTPGTSWKWCEALANSGVINLKLIGTGEAIVNSWRYYVDSTQLTLQWGLDLYPRKGEEITDVVFKFYQIGSSIPIEYVCDKRNSYSGKFYEYLNYGDVIKKDTLYYTEIFIRIMRSDGTIKDQKVDGRFLYTLPVFNNSFDVEQDFKLLSPNVTVGTDITTVNDSTETSEQFAGDVGYTFDTQKTSLEGKLTKSKTYTVKSDFKLNTNIRGLIVENPWAKLNNTIDTVTLSDISNVNIQNGATGFTTLQAGDLTKNGLRFTYTGREISCVGVTDANNISVTFNSENKVKSDSKDTLISGDFNIVQSYLPTNAIYNKHFKDVFGWDDTVASFLPRYFFTIRNSNYAATGHTSWNRNTLNKWSTSEQLVKEGPKQTKGGFLFDKDFYLVQNLYNESLGGVPPMLFLGGYFGYHVSRLWKTKKNASGEAVGDGGTLGTDYLFPFMKNVNGEYVPLNLKYVKGSNFEAFNNIFSKIYIAQYEEGVDLQAKLANNTTYENKYKLKSVVKTSVAIESTANIFKVQGSDGSLIAISPRSFTGVTLDNEDNITINSTVGLNETTTDLYYETPDVGSAFSSYINPSVIVSGNTFGITPNNGLINYDADGLPIQKDKMYCYMGGALNKIGFGENLVIDGSTVSCYFAIKNNGKFNELVVDDTKYDKDITYAICLGLSSLAHDDDTTYFAPIKLKK